MSYGTIHTGTRRTATNIVIFIFNLMEIVKFCFWLLLFNHEIASVLSFSAPRPDMWCTHTQQKKVNNTKRYEMTRKGYIQSIAIAILGTTSALVGATSFNQPAFAFIAENKQADLASATASTIAYKELKIKIPTFNVDVPVAMWFKPDEDDLVLSQKNDNVVYSHRISVKRIGSLLAGLDFIPEFVAKDFQLGPTTTAKAVDGESMSFPSDRPVVLLAHGFLGSRFDLSHLAEELAQQGFVCFSPEYPESLASSYTKMDGLDRGKINDRLLGTIQNDLGIKAKSYGIVGHSLGCGTATTTGDDSWTRVCIAGPPVRRDGVKVGGNILAITSLNDGLVTLSRLESMLPSDFARLQEATMMSNPLPSRAVLIFDREDAPNHISFLAGNVNDSMVSFLSPLLPVAQALSIPVLDFDKYKESRDSVATANVVIPLVSSYLKQYML